MTADVDRFRAEASHLWNIGNHDAAEDAMRRAVGLSPDDPKLLAGFGEMLRNQDRADEAAATFRRMFALWPVPAAKLVASTILPAVYESLDDLHRRRARLTENLRQLHDEGFTVDIERIPVMPVFPLAYQGEDDLELQRSFAALLRPPPDVPLADRPRRERIRIGFISTMFRDHTIARHFKGLIAQMDRSRFEVIVLSIGEHDDGEARFIRNAAEKYIVVPAFLPDARDLIRQQALDVLFYTDVGMDAITYSLAFSRLAPVQCVSYGHPITTGVPTLDYFISSSLLEPPDAQKHYSEQVVQLSWPPVYYYPPRAAPAKRRDFGLPDDAHLYGCLQSVFKIHPHFDAAIAAILQRDPQGMVLLLEGGTMQQTRRLAQRLSRSAPIERIRFVKGMEIDRFLSLQTLCDVMLDPIYFCGGNTAYEALALGVPMVTMPGPALKGRFTATHCRAMGITECIASSLAEYAEIAVGIATDPARRRQISERIFSRRDVVFENAQGVRDFERWLIAASAGE